MKSFIQTVNEGKTASEADIKKAYASRGVSGSGSTEKDAEAVCNVLTKKGIKCSKDEVIAVLKKLGESVIAEASPAQKAFDDIMNSEDGKEFGNAWNDGDAGKMDDIVDQRIKNKSLAKKVKDLY